MERYMTFRKVDRGSERRFAIGVPLQLHGPIGMVAITVGPAFLLFLLLPAQLVPPVLGILSFVIASLAAMCALLTRANGSAIWTIASVFTFTWIIAGLVSNPKHVLDWFDHVSMVP
jgi:hypothetical protein